MAGKIVAGLLVLAGWWVGSAAQAAALPFAPPKPDVPPPYHSVPTAADRRALAECDRNSHKVGDQARCYWFAPGGAVMPYRLFVPSRWAPQVRLPVIVLLHGGGGDQSSVLDSGHRVLETFAQQRGYILVAPLGYTRTAGFGSMFAPPPTPGGAALPPFANAHDAGLSELDTLAVLDRTLEEYHADPARVYLMGNSMGGSGTWYLTEKFPERWAAVAPSDGPPRPADYPFERLKGVNILAIHGVNDVLAPIEATRQMVERANAAGANARFLPIPNGEHAGAWLLALPKVFDFFDSHPGRGGP